MSDFIDRARALDKAATEGPWRHWPEAGDIEIATDDYRKVICPKVRPKKGWPRGWEESSAYRHGEEHDAEFIAAARSMLPAAVEALARVRELHVRGTALVPLPYGGVEEETWCVECGRPWPCETREVAEVEA